MRGDRIPANILSVQYIPHADPGLIKGLRLIKGYGSLGILTVDSDDVGYTALDEATKKADVRVAYAKSMYAGASNASTRLAGEFIGILAGPTPEEVRSGVEAAVAYIQNVACFYSANQDNSIIYYAHCISRTGSFLSKESKVPLGSALAYLIAPPCEAMKGLDAALKAAPVELKVLFSPPTQTNFAGGLLTGEQSACQAACEAFAEQVCRIADQPIER